MCSIKLTNFKLFAATTLMLQLIYANKLYENLQQPLKRMECRKCTLKKFLQQIEAEENYKTCVIFGKATDEEYALEEILQMDLQKMVVLQKDLTIVSKCCGYHTKFLAITFWQEEKASEFLNILADILTFKRRNKLVVIKNDLERSVNLSVIKDFFDLSKFYKFPNLVLLFKDFYKTHNLYQYQIYPNISVGKLNLNNNSLNIFPNKMKNLYGAAIRTVPDQVLPRTAAIIDDLGRLQVKGYVMKFIDLFSKYVNATLEFPLNITIGKIIVYADIYNITQQEQIDIPASLTTYIGPKSYLIMSNAYEINNWCIIVPIEPPSSYQEYLDKHIDRKFLIYYIVVRYIFSIILVLSTKLWSLKNNLRYSVRFTDILVNSNLVAGLFGGSFKLLPDPSKSLRFIYITVFISGLVHSIILSSQMQSFLTHPYSYRIQTLADFPLYNLRVLIPQKDFQFMVRYYNFSPEWLSLIFQITPDINEFSQIQTSLNTSYAYPISSPLWFMYDALQTYTNKPIFRLTRICFPYTGIMAFVLPPNSMLMEPLNDLIARVRDMGLLEFWLKTSYIDLVKMKKIYLPKDRTVVQKSSILVIEDFRYVWRIMVKSFIMTICVFVGEIIWFRLWAKRNK